MNKRALGTLLDDPDEFVNRVVDVISAISTINAVSRAGVIAAVLEGPSTLDALASRSGMPAAELGRILDFLAAHEMLERNSDGRFAPTRRTAQMQEIASLMACCEYAIASGSKLLQGLKQGKTPFQVLHGEPVFEYFSNHPAEAAMFGDFMGYMTRRILKFILSKHRFEPFATVADIGGSLGDFLLAILEHHPGTKGILFDRPEVVEMARPGIGASQLAARIELVGGNFFEAVPSADLYVLKQLLHDWHDDECLQILRNIRAAINPGGRLAVIDHLLAEVPTPDEGQATDISMMVWDTGRERKQLEFEALFAVSGFRLDRISRNPNGHSVIEAVPV
jgi:hypothetical protein